MSRTRNAVSVLGLAWLGFIHSAPATAQQVRLAGWGVYEDVESSNDWWTLGGRLTFAATRGDAGWVALEGYGRFGAEDVSVRVGAVLHPTPRWWVTVEGTTSPRPAFLAKNSWEADVTALVGKRASAGMGFRRQNYAAGAVNLVMPHATLHVAGVSLDGRVFVSRNPSERTDVAFMVRAGQALGPHGAFWLGGGAGRESYVVGTPPLQAIASLETVTGTGGIRYTIGANALRLDVTVVHSKTALSRKGISLMVERAL
jgi:YaiO family outer membrane protein